MSPAIAGLPSRKLALEILIKVDKSKSYSNLALNAAFQRKTLPTNTHHGKFDIDFEHRGSETIIPSQCTTTYDQYIPSARDCSHYRKLQ